uniref:Sm protein B n=1 Tax=Panagrellus redivivus TaxID=6233 RepID=A0A7E4VML3_PANRE
MTISKNNKMMSHLNYRMKAIVQDSRTFVGYFKAFDKHMNIILSECEELRPVKPKPNKPKPANTEEKRVLGLVLLRGDKIISLSVDGPPQKEEDGLKMPKVGNLGGPGVARPAARNMPMMAPPVAPIGVPAAGLQGAVRGVGGPGANIMQPGFGGPRPPY